MLYSRGYRAWRGGVTRMEGATIVISWSQNNVVLHTLMQLIIEYLRTERLRESTPNLEKNVEYALDRLDIQWASSARMILFLVRVPPYKSCAVPLLRKIGTTRPWNVRLALNEPCKDMRNRCSGTSSWSHGICWERNRASACFKSFSMQLVRKMCKRPLHFCPFPIDKLVQV